MSEGTTNAGEWQVEEAVGCVLVRDTALPVIFDRVAILPWGEERAIRTKAEALEVARLMAAAPRLLAVCAALSAAWEAYMADDLYTNPHDCIPERLFDDLGLAVRQATGLAALAATPESEGGLDQHVLPPRDGDTPTTAEPEAMP